MPLDPVLFLATSPRDPDVAALADRRRIGVIAQPGSNPPRPGWIWAADNGCFGATFDPRAWRAWLDRQPRAGCLFAVVPDVVADHAATRVRFDEYADLVPARFALAYAAQDGATVEALPWDRFDALFVGGSTNWKLSEAAHDLARAARARSKWVHVGRVNSAPRYRAWSSDADSCDGSILAFGPQTNLRRVTGWIDDHDRAPQLWQQT